MCVKYIYTKLVTMTTKMKKYTPKYVKNQNENEKLKIF